MNFRGFQRADSSNSVQCADLQFAIRKPPIALIHGYNTTGDWGFRLPNILGASWPLTEDVANNFIVTVKIRPGYNNTLPRADPAFPSMSIRSPCWTTAPRWLCSRLTVDGSLQPVGFHAIRCRGPQSGRGAHAHKLCNLNGNGLHSPTFSATQPLLSRTFSPRCDHRLAPQWLALVALPAGFESTR